MNAKRAEAADGPLDELVDGSAFPVARPSASLSGAQKVHFGPQMLPPSPRRTLRKTLLIIAIGPLLGIVEVAGLLAYYRTLDQPLKVQALVWTFVNTLLWGLVLPLVVRWSERDPLRPGRLGPQVARHVGRALVASLGTVILIGLARWASYSVFGTELMTPRKLLAALFSGWLVYDFFMYAVLLGIVSAIAAQRELSAKTLEQARLETALVETEIKLLKAELDPHFLFNALHTISALVYRDPAAADRMICRLSDFLRLSLATAGSPEVTLQQELEHLSSYMDVQMVRFRGRLALDVEVPIELLACRVPNLLLQPLIENVVKHAVALSHRPVRAVVSARREGAQLVLEITDNGPGLPSTGSAPGDATLHEGIGLANTRGRLLKLYAADHRLTIVSRPEGGTRVTIALPFALSIAPGSGLDDGRGHGAAGPGDADITEDMPHVASSHR